MTRAALLILGAAAAALLASTAQASVSVLGGGLANDCSVAALAGRADRRSIDLCSEAISAEPLMARELAGTYVNRGVMRLRQRDFDGARADFDKALSYQPDLGEAYVNRGAALVGQRRYSEGLADIDKGLALGPEEPEKAWFNRALAHEGLDDMKAAYFDYRKAADLKPDWEQPQRELRRFTVSTVGG